MWWIIVIGIIVFIIYRLTKEHDEYVDKHITSFGGMRVWATAQWCRCPEWTYPSGYPQDKMIEEMENYMTWLMEEYQRLSKG